MNTLCRDPEWDGGEWPAWEWRPQLLPQRRATVYPGREDVGAWAHNIALGAGPWDAWRESSLHRAYLETAVAAVKAVEGCKSMLVASMVAAAVVAEVVAVEVDS